MIELSDHLSRSPSPLMQSWHPVSRRTPKPGAPRHTHEIYARSRSLDPLDDNDPAPLGTEPDISKSASAVHLDATGQEATRRGASFQKAIADVGILSSLPKPPSSNTLNLLSANQKKSFVTPSVRNSTRDRDATETCRRSMRKNVGWNEVELDEGNSLPTLRNFVGLRSGGLIENYPASVDFADGGNVNGNHVPTYKGVTQHLEPSTRHLQHVQISHSIAPRQGPTTRNVCGGRTVPETIDVVRYDSAESAWEVQRGQQQHSESDRWADATKFSPEPHSPVSPRFDLSAIWTTGPRPTDRQSARQQVGHDPYYGTATSRAQRNAMPERGVTSSSWSRPGRHVSASIAVQTDSADPSPAVAPASVI